MLEDVANLELAVFALFCQLMIQLITPINHVFISFDDGIKHLDFLCDHPLFKT